MIAGAGPIPPMPRDRKSTRLNSSHSSISYAVFCLKKKTTTHVGSSIRHLATDSLQRHVQASSFNFCSSSLLLLCGTAVFFFNDTATTEIYTLSLHDALPI